MLSFGEMLSHSGMSRKNSNLGLIAIGNDEDSRAPLLHCRVTFGFFVPALLLKC